MPYETTSHLLTWITFVPLIGTGIIGAALALKPLFKLNQGLVDNLSRAAVLIASAIPLFCVSKYLKNI